MLKRLGEVTTHTSKYHKGGGGVEERFIDLLQSKMFTIQRP